MRCIGNRIYVMKLLEKPTATSGQIVKELRQYLDTYPDFCVRFYEDGDEYYIRGIAESEDRGDDIKILQMSSDEDEAMTIESLIEELEVYEETCGVVVDFDGAKNFDLEDGKVFQFEDDDVDIWFNIGVKDARTFSVVQLRTDLERFSKDYAGAPVRFINYCGDEFSITDIDWDDYRLFIDVRDDEETVTVQEFLEMSDYSDEDIGCRVLSWGDNNDLDDYCWDDDEAAATRTIQQLPDGHIFYVEKDDNGDSVVFCQLGELLFDEHQDMII